MSGSIENDSRNASSSQNSVAFLDGDYVGKEVVVIAFDQEKTSVTLDDNFILVQSIEKREKLVKIMAAIVAMLGLLAIVVASVKVAQGGGSTKEPQIVVVIETPVVTDTIVPTDTLEPTCTPTVKPTPKPKPTPKVTKKPSTPKPKPTPKPNTPKPMLTKKPKKSDTTFTEEADGPFSEE